MFVRNGEVLGSVQADPKTRPADIEPAEVKAPKAVKPAEPEPEAAPEPVKSPEPEPTPEPESEPVKAAPKKAARGGLKSALDTPKG